MIQRPADDIMQAALAYIESMQWKADLYDQAIFQHILDLENQVALLKVANTLLVEEMTVLRNKFNLNAESSQK